MQLRNAEFVEVPVSQCGGSEGVGSGGYLSHFDKQLEPILLLFYALLQEKLSNTESTKT